MRSILERQVAIELARSISEANLAELERLNALQHEAHRAGRDTEAMRIAEEFHLTAAKMTGNQVLYDLLENLILRTALILSLYGTRNRSECGLDEHEIILLAMRNRDEIGAAKAMEHHLEHVVERAIETPPETEAQTIQAIMQKYARIPAD